MVPTASRPTVPGPALVLLIVITAALTACGGTDDSGDSPPPTLADLDVMVTSAAALRVTEATPTPPDTATPTATSTPPPSDTVIPATPTPTHTLPPTATATPTALSTEQQHATGIALTNTALALTKTAAAGALPITETVAAISQATQTADAQLAALITLTPSPEAVEFTPEITPDPALAEPFQVVFYSDRYGSDDVFLMTLNRVERLLVASPANEREPDCAPDASAVVFASDATGRFQLYLQRLDSATAIQLTDSEGMNFAPRFSPDGSHIAFVSTRNQGIPTIWLMDADGGNQRQVTTDLGRDTSPDWGPDNRQMLFASDQNGPWDLFLTVFENGVEGEFPLLPPEFSDGNQVWPLFDALGERIAYTTWEDLGDPQTADIYLLDFEQPAPVEVRAGAGADIAWSWGDDEHLLASVGGPDDVQIALVDITTGEAIPLTDAGTFNGGARLCTVDPAILPPEPPPPASPTPTPTATPTATTAPATATATATPKPTATSAVFSPALLAAQGRPHIVQSGESLITIASTYGVEWTTLAELNNISDPSRLQIGQRLTVPVTRVVTRFGGYQQPDSEIDAVEQIHKKIIVKLDEQRAYAYENGRLIRTFNVSTGLPDTPTVEGEYSIYYKLPAQTMSGAGYYLPGVPYVMYFYQGYGLHGTYWHDKFGQPMSHGCVNLPTPQAKWLYNWAEIGTPVSVKP